MFNFKNGLFDQPKTKITSNKDMLQQLEKILSNVPSFNQPKLFFNEPDSVEENPEPVTQDQPEQETMDQETNDEFNNYLEDGDLTEEVPEELTKSEASENIADKIEQFYPVEESDAAEPITTSFMEKTDDASKQKCPETEQDQQFLRADFREIPNETIEELPFDPANQERLIPDIVEKLEIMLEEKQSFAPPNQEFTKLGTAAKSEGIPEEKQPFDPPNQELTKLGTAEKSEEISEEKQPFDPQSQEFSNPDISEKAEEILKEIQPYLQQHQEFTKADIIETVEETNEKELPLPLQEQEFANPCNMEKLVEISEGKQALPLQYQEYIKHEVDEEPADIPAQTEHTLAQETDNVLHEGQKAKGESNISETKVIFHQPDCEHSERCVNILGKTLQNCVSVPVAISTIFNGGFVKIPVVLAEFQVQLFLNSTISLPEQALEIKEIKKNVKLTQSLLLQEPGPPINPGNLFLKGFIRKNIAYASRNCSSSSDNSSQGGVCGDIRHCTIDVPFNCVTRVTFDVLPVPPIENSVSEFQYFRRQNLKGPGFAEKDQLLSSDLSEFNQISTEYFNELPFCELVSARILEYNEFLDRTSPKEATLPFEEKEFSAIEEKMVLYLTVKLLQKQQVFIPPTIKSIPPSIAGIITEEFVRTASSNDSPTTEQEVTDLASEEEN